MVIRQRWIKYDVMWTRLSAFITYVTYEDTGIMESGFWKERNTFTSSRWTKSLSLWLLFFTKRKQHFDMCTYKAEPEQSWQRVATFDIAIYNCSDDHS